MEAWKEELYHHGVKGMKWGKHKMSDAELAARTAEANYRATNGLATDVIRGKYGNEADRQRALGASYYRVQSQVNQRLLGRKATPGNYANDQTKYSSAQWRQEMMRQAQARRQKQAVEQRRRNTVDSGSGSKGNGKSKSYNAGYNFVKNLFGKKKKK